MLCSWPSPPGCVAGVGGVVGRREPVRVVVEEPDVVGVCSFEGAAPVTNPPDLEVKVPWVVYRHNFADDVGRTTNCVRLSSYPHNERNARHEHVRNDLSGCLGRVTWNRTADTHANDDRVVISVEKENVFSVEKEHTKGLLRWYSRSTVPAHRTTPRRMTPGHSRSEGTLEGSLEGRHFRSSRSASRELAPSSISKRVNSVASGYCHRNSLKASLAGRASATVEITFSSPP
jgi:hypothetical protein